MDRLPQELSHLAFVAFQQIVDPGLKIYRLLDQIKDPNAVVVLFSIKHLSREMVVHWVQNLFKKIFFVDVLEDKHKHCSALRKNSWR